MKLADLRRKLEVVEKDRASRLAESGRSVVYLKTELKQSLKRLRALQTTSKDEHVQLMRSIDSALSRSKAFNQSHESKKAMLVAKENYFTNVKQLSVPWLQVRAMPCTSHGIE
jgi:hypothetical protein